MHGGPRGWGAHGRPQLVWAVAMLESASRAVTETPSNLSLIREVQVLDQRIAALTAEIDSLPKHVAAIESALAAHKQQLASLRATLNENAKEHRLLDKQVGDQKQKIAHLQEQMNSAKTNVQFHAFQREIRFCKDKIDEIEERILDKMEQADALNERIAMALADLEVESANVARQVEEAKQRIAVHERERAEKQAARRALCEQVEPSTLSLYERVRRAKGTAVAAVGGERCGACHVRLRPQFLQNLRLRTDDILTCERCGLILYLPLDQDRAEEPSAAPAAPEAA